ncbi:MAG: DUF1302 family protein [Desulfobacula sp.]|nr:DUF1302 family protein [Desulfobacula sp.]
MLSENSSALPSSRVKNITFDKQQRQEIVIVFLEKLPEIKYFVLHNPERIVVDIKDAFVPQINISQETRGEAVKKIRIGQNSKDTARIILDVNKNIPYIFSILGEMVNDKPAVKIMVSLFQKEENRILSPVINFFDTTEANLKFMEKPIKKNAIKNLEIQKSQEPQKLIGSLVLFDDAMPDDILDQPDKDEKESDLTISCILHVRTTLQTKEEDAVENNTSLRNRILVETKYKSMLTLSVLSDYLYFGREDETSDYDLDLYEAKWQYNEKKYGVSIGKQIIRWGKTDQFSPVDTLNPQDLREFILPEYEERKIPIWMADLNLFFDNFNLEGVFIPFFEESRIDYFDTNWSIFGHMKKELQNAPISPSLKTYFENLSVNENTPDKEAEFALRLTTTVKNMDMGLTFHHTTEDTPYFKSFPVKNISVNGNFSPEGLTSLLDSAILTNEAIEVEYKKTNIAGLEFETIFYDFGFRGEAAWQENESFLTSSLTSTRKSTFTYILGADYTTRNNIYFNLQFAHRHISNYNPEILYFDQNTVSLLGEINKDILVDWLNACLEYNINLNNNAWYLSPQLKYTYITNLECIVGASIFSGDRDTWFGKFKDYDLLFLNIIYHF